jgi:transposase
MQAPATRVDTEKLLAIQQLQEREIDRLLGVVREQRRELARLKGEDEDQAELALLRDLEVLEFRSPGKAQDEPSLEAPEPTPPTAVRRGHGPRPQPSLPEVEVIHELAAEDRECPVCHEQTLEPLGDQTEDSEEITIELKRVLKLRHRRRKYRCRCHAAVVTAPGPRKLIPGGRYSLDFAVWVAVTKMVDHVPLHRQVRMLGRSGLEVTRQALWDQMRALATPLERTYQRIYTEILSSPLLHADETGFLVTTRSRSQRQTLWSLSTTELAYFKLARKDYRAGQELLGEYQGIVVADGYAVYPKLSRAGPMRLAHCWAHSLRKFRDAAAHRPEECAQILGLVGDLYEIERQAAAEHPGDLEHRARVRATHSRAKIEEIKRWALSQTGLPRSDFMKAVRYMLERWAGLTLFLEEPLVPLDNNRAENSLRGPVVGRKNYLQFRSLAGCETGAILYSLCETARLQGVAPELYLRIAAERALDRPGTATLPSEL